MKDALYRFEVFDIVENRLTGEGMFQGLYDILPDVRTANEIQALFADLESPELDEPCVFYFTPAGVAANLGAICALADAVAPYGRCLAMARLEDWEKRYGSDVIYRDADQVAFALDWFVPQDGADYAPMDRDAVAAVAEKYKIA